MAAPKILTEPAMTNASWPLPYVDDIESIPEDEAHDIQRLSEH